jgi:hypothetical protein
MTDRELISSVYNAGGLGMDFDVQGWLRFGCCAKSPSAQEAKGKNHDRLNSNRTA